MMSAIVCCTFAIAVGRCLTCQVVRSCVAVRGESILAYHDDVR